MMGFMERTRSQDTANSVMRQIHERPFVPLLMLLALLLTIGWLNSEFLTPYSRPIMAADGQGAFVFYDAAAIDPQKQASFAFRRTDNGQVWSAEKRVEGQLQSAVLKDDSLFLMFPGFYSRYQRKSLKRLETRDLTELDFQPRAMFQDGGELFALGLNTRGWLEAQRIWPSMGPRLDLGDVESLVPDKQSTLKKTDKKGPRIVEKGRERTELRATFSIATVNSETVILGVYSRELKRSQIKTLNEKVKAPRMPGPNSEKTVLWARFSKGQMGPIHKLNVPASMAALYGRGQELELIVVPKTQTYEVESYSLNLETGETTLKGKIPYERIGWFSSHKVTSLSLGTMDGKRTLLAQFGATIRMHRETEDPPWTIVAQLPGEARTLVYGWIIFVLVLAILLVWTGVQSMRQNALDLRSLLVDEPRPEDFEEPGSDDSEDSAESSSDDSEDPSEDDGEDKQSSGDQQSEAPKDSAPESEPKSEEQQAETKSEPKSEPRSEPASVAPRLGAQDSSEAQGFRDASIMERALAFGMDLLVLFPMVMALSLLLPTSFLDRLVELRGVDQNLVVQQAYWQVLTGRGFLSPEFVVLAAFHAFLGLIYFTVAEAMFGRTVGKLMFGLEVRRVGGEPLTWLQSFYRNVFRIELFFGQTGLIFCCVSLPIMLLTERTQRPGDLLAQSVVLTRDVNLEAETGKEF